VIGNRRFLITFAAVLTLLAVTNLVDKFGPTHTGLVLGPAVALVLIGLARRRGLSWDDLGMSRRTWRRGAEYAVAAVALVAAVYLLAAVLPATRPAFLDSRYHLPPRSALMTALVVIPLSTVLLEEVAFRGVLMGLIHRHRGIAWASASSSVLFGLWHVLPSLHLREANHAVGGVVGSGPGGQILTVLAAVVFTAVAGLLLCELRRRSGSLLAAAGLHWATNGLAVMLATGLWTIRIA
jgi:membrane protease YdiL (CAAX protease family)